VARERRYIGWFAFASVAAVCLATGLSACSPELDSPPVAGLADTSWTVSTINGGGVIPEAPPTITFSNDKRVSGTTGCNQYSALFSTNRSRITIGALTAAEMACEGAQSAQEAAFLKGLDGAATWHVTETGALEIGGVATIVAEPGVAASRPPPSSGAALAGTAWNLAEMGGTADFADIVPTIEFGADGRASGFAGCNTFTGTFTTDGTTLAIGPLATTKIACLRPASEVESEYLGSLAGVTSWEIGSDGQLTLGGAATLLYTPR
jgi:heat shock protein HslJ